MPWRARAHLNPNEWKLWETVYQQIQLPRLHYFHLHELKRHHASPISFANKTAGRHIQENCGVPLASQNKYLKSKLLKLTTLDSQLAATLQKSSCSLVTSNGESRDSGSTLSLPSAAVERLGFEAWRRVEEMQLGTCSRAAKSSACI